MNHKQIAMPFLLIPTQLMIRKEAVKKREEERRHGFPLKIMVKEGPSKTAESDYVSLVIYFSVFAIFYLII